MGNAMKAIGLKSPQRCDLLAAELNAYVEQLEISNAETKNYLQKDVFVDFIDQDSLTGYKESALNRAERSIVLLDQSFILKELSDLVSESKSEFRDADKYLIEGMIFTERRSLYNQDASSLMDKAARAEAESKVLRVQIQQLRDKLKFTHLKRMTGQSLE